MGEGQRPDLQCAEMRKGGGGSQLPHIWSTQAGIRDQHKLAGATCATPTLCQSGCTMPSRRTLRGGYLPLWSRCWLAVTERGHGLWGGRRVWPSVVADGMGISGMIEGAG